MIFAIIIIVAIVFFFVFDYIATERAMDESENRIVAMLKKAIDNVNIFFVGIFTSLWNWGDTDDDEITD